VAGRRWEDQIHVIVAALIGYFPETSFALTGLSLRTGFLECIAPLVAAVGMFVGFRKRDRLLVPLTVTQYCGLLLSTAGSRYIIFMIPFLYIFLAAGTSTCVEFLTRRIKRVIDPGRVIIVLFVVLALFNVGHNLKTIADARSALENGGPESERSLPFFVAARWLKANAADAVILTSRPRIINYLSGCRTISLVRSGVPDHEVWVNREDWIQRLLEVNRPDFLFADSKDKEMYSQVIKTIIASGLELEEIIEAESSRRYRVFRIVGFPKPEAMEPAN